MAISVFHIAELATLVVLMLDLHFATRSADISSSPGPEWGLLRRIRNMRILACLCFATEGQYVAEWLEYHRKMGFEHFFILDNNRNQDDIEYVDAIKSAPDVTYVNKRDRPYEQARWYQDIYARLTPDDWCAFIDTDEYITVNRNTTLRKLLEGAHERMFTTMKLNWLAYGNNGHLNHTKGTQIERFPKYALLGDDSVRHYNLESKVLIRGGMRVWAGTVHHFAGPGVVACDPEYKAIPYDTHWVPRSNYKVAYIRHYFTRSEQEWRNKRAKWLIYVRIGLYPWPDYNMMNRCPPNVVNWNSNETGQILGPEHFAPCTNVTNTDGSIDPWPREWFDVHIPSAQF